MTHAELENIADGPGGFNATLWASRAPSPSSAHRRRRAFWSELRRTIRGSLRRFPSIAAITFLGVTMLTCLRVACLDLRASADGFFDSQGLFDVRVVSTLGPTDED